MRKKNSIKNRAYHYVVFILIILSGIVLFYLSCKSKSPTEATSALHNQVASQSTNNTTTSSSTTTTVKPGNSPTNTTTLITSRTLTSTSSTTSSTSTTSTSTTTSRQPTTSTTTTTTSTPLAECDIRWPRRPARSRGYVLIKGTRYYHGDTLYVKSGYSFRVTATICNYGSVTWDGTNYLTMRLWKNGTVAYGYALGLAPFPPGGSSSCRTATNPHQFTVRKNSRLQIEFAGKSAHMACNSDIIIYFQLIE